MGCSTSTRPTADGISYAPGKRGEFGKRTALQDLERLLSERMTTTIDGTPTTAATKDMDKSTFTLDAKGASMLSYIGAYVRVKGMPPTWSEIRRDLGLPPAPTWQEFAGWQEAGNTSDRGPFEEWHQRHPTLSQHTYRKREFAH
jgi:hypothetical protein